MDFKKDYINYVLHTVIQNEFYGARDDIRIRKILEKIILIPDVAKATFLAGKTAGLEILFKYLLYISDKIDKSQLTVFNLKDNFEYDLQNLKKICEGIKKYRSEIQKPAVEEKEHEIKNDVISGKAIVEDSREPEELAEDNLSEDNLSEDNLSEDNLSEVSLTEENLSEENLLEENLSEEESEENEEEQGFTLIENKRSESSDDEVFGLAGITRSIEMDEEAENVSLSNEQETAAPETDEEISDTEEESIRENEFDVQPAEKVTESDTEAGEDDILTASDVEKINRIKEKGEIEKGASEKEELEIEIKNSAKQEDEQTDEMKEGSVTSDVYYRFENKFFEEVKILEKLFSNAEKECRAKLYAKPLAKLSEKSLQSFSEIIEISSELASLTRQLSLDLTAEIFLTINLLFTKAINNPSLINPERTKLLSSSLLLVTSLIKGEDYLGYDELVKKLESLKEELKKPVEPPKKEIIEEKPKSPIVSPEPVKKTKVEPETTEPETLEPETTEPEATVPETAEPETLEPEAYKPVEVSKNKTKPIDYPKEIIKKHSVNTGESESPNMETVLFKMKYLVKEFEKNFTNVSSSDGEYTKFEILDEIDNLNNLLRMLAKISASVKNSDVLKLSEVSYVFLKYLKDYRMNLLDAEIQQIIKYIIFTFKMLLTDRKPEDFDVLVQYLNNPVKIFTDT